MTDKQKKEHIESGGVTCPFCKSDDIATTESDFDEAGYKQQIKCYSCKREWSEFYKLDDVEEV